jgi:hypothetical protein
VISDIDKRRLEFHQFVHSAEDTLYPLPLGRRQQFKREQSLPFGILDMIYYFHLSYFLRLRAKVNKEYVASLSFPPAGG